jgi:hypothetical protein
VRVIPARLETYRVSTAGLARGAGKAIAVSAWITAGVACPSAHADSIYGTGTYIVPGELPYGIYIAHADPAANSSIPAACTFSTWTSNGKLISADGGNQTDTRIARILGPAVAKFITHGCSPWTKVG